MHVINSALLPIDMGEQRGQFSRGDAFLSLSVAPVISSALLPTDMGGTVGQTVLWGGMNFFRWRRKIQTFPPECRHVAFSYRGDVFFMSSAPHFSTN